ncbi:MULTISPECIES: cytochrome c maturation protein CcmE [Alkalimonas]|uniref:Cytochrome c-type biogenesis protein CcmE n=1 Tax=Alkalimonas mucilaginosa TaxID=3057676 RepID=A0ABU7JI53_9GAMM|nr:cytochrome c maturation protein CcmE [Alkalimonas sp. MEB004]MEE2025101.1 cytochrome c maturation protein CcmE [Alkalimonas sp. MEB004]
MNARRQKRLWSIVAMLALVAGSIGAMLYALQQNINLFYTPTQLVEGIGADKIRPEIGQRLRIGGVVVEGSVVRDPDSLLVRFDLVDTGPTVTVEYNGILPDLFREGQGIVAQGHLVEERLIRASEVLAKHDEEYMPPEVAKALKGIKHVPPSQQTATESAGGY